MEIKTKKIKAAGKFSSSGGVSVRNKYNAIESLQRISQPSPFHPTGRAKRLSSGIWKCVKTGKVFAGHAYYLEGKK